MHQSREQAESVKHHRLQLTAGGETAAAAAARSVVHSPLPFFNLLSRQCCCQTDIQSTMAAPFTRLAANGAKRLGLRPQTRIATPLRRQTQLRCLSSTPARRMAEPIENPNATRLIPVDPNFGHPVDANSMSMNGANDKADSPDERKIRHYTVNFGPQHPAAHGVLRLIL